MRRERVGSNVVIVAQHFNPSVISQLWLVRRGLSHTLAGAALAILVLVVLLGIAAVLVAEVGQIVHDRKIYIEKLDRINYHGSIAPTAETLRALQVAHLLTVPLRI